MFLDFLHVFQICLVSNHLEAEPEKTSTCLPLSAGRGTALLPRLPPGPGIGPRRQWTGWDGVG